MTTEKPFVKKTLQELNDEFKPFWDSYFKKKGIENPQFHAKLCYIANDFSSKGIGAIPVLRFYEEQISKNQDVYVELHNFDQKPYYENERVLYKFVNNSDWKKDEDDYVLFTHAKNGALLQQPSYSFKLACLKEVARSSSKFSELQVETNTLVDEQQALPLVDFKAIDSEIFGDDFLEKDDAHYAQMTIRDIYCIFNKVPMSNKKWLNNLINDGTQWQNLRQQK